MRTLSRLLLLSLLFGGVSLAACSTGNVLQTSDRNILSISVVEDTIPEAIIEGQLDSAGIKMRVSYSDGTSEEIPVTTALLGPKYAAMAAKEGVYDIELLYRGKTVRFRLNVVKSHYPVNFYAYQQDATYSLVASYQIPYGTAATAPEITLSLYDATKHYTFVDWDKSFSKVTHSLDVYALYDSVNYYTVNFYNADNALLKSEKVDEGANATPPSYEVLQMEGKDFLGWDRDYRFVTQNISVYGIYVGVTGTSETPESPSEQPTPTPITPSQPDPTPVDPSASVQITNKSALTEEWRIEDPDRMVELSLNPTDNVAQAIADGIIKITSSDTGVIQVFGRALHAVSAGMATITVAYHGVTDSVEISTLPKKTAQEKYGTVHGGTLEDPLDNTDAIKVGLWCRENGNTPEELYVTGTVDSFYHAPGSREDGAVSFFLSELVEGEGRFEVYRCYKSVNGDQVAIGENEIWKGATIVAHGIFTYYAGGKQAEITGGFLDSVTGEKPADPIDITATVAQAIEAGLKLADGDSTYDYYVVTGYVVKKIGNNFFLSDSGTLADGTDDKQLLELYGISKDEDKALLTKGAKVTVKLHLKNYHGQIRNSVDVTITLVTAGTPWEIQYTDATVTEALTVAKALEGGATTSAYYKVTGVVKEIISVWSAKYGNVSFTIADSADATETITVYRLTVSEAKAATIVPGCTVVIGGQLFNYVKDNVSNGELIPSELFEVRDAGGQNVVNYGTLEAPLSVADLLGDNGTLCAQTNGSFSAQKVVVKGVVTSAEYSDKYGTWTLVLADAKGGTVIKATGLHLKEEAAATIAVNDTVIVEHYLEYYNYGYSLYYKMVDNVRDYGDVLSRVAIGTSVLTVEGNEHATVTGLAESYQNDETATFTVTPAEGYEIVSVSVYGKVANVGEGGTYTVKVAGDGVIKVVVKEANAPAPSKVTWTANRETLAPFPADYSATAAETGWDVVIGDETVKMNGANIKNNSTYLMMGSKAQSAVSFFYNETAFSRAITKVTITTGSIASNSAKYNVTFGADAAVSTAVEANSGVTVAKDTAQEFTPAEGVAAKYFQIASTNTSVNGEIAKIEIEFIDDDNTLTKVIYIPSDVSSSN